MPADSEASLRENLAEQLTGAQNELSANLIALRSSGNADPALVAQGDAQLGALLALKRQLAQASPATLARVQAEISACVATASNVAQQAQTAASGGAKEASALATASAAAREAVTNFADDYFRNRKFDPYLTFASEEEEREFRKREAQREEDIRKAMALNTPEGDLRAAQLSKEQLLDAGAHGADRNPDYAADLAKLSAASSELKGAIAPHGRAGAKTRMDIAQSTQVETDVPEIPPGVLAALRQVRSPDQDAAGHGLDDKAVAALPDRSPVGRG